MDRSRRIEETKDIFLNDGLIRVQRNYWECTSIETEKWLVETLGSKVDDYDPNEDASGWLSGDEDHILKYLQEKTGREYKAVSSADNVYNHEQDFYNVFIYQVFAPVDASDDWMWEDDCFVATQTHIAGDVRENYRGVDIYGPINNIGDTGFADWSIGWYLEFMDGEPADEYGEYDTGYSSCPTYHLYDALVGGRAFWSDKSRCFLGRHAKLRRTVKMFPQVRIGC